MAAWRLYRGRVIHHQTNVNNNNADWNGVNINYQSFITD